MALRSPGTRTIRWGLVFLAVFVLALFSPERAFAAAPDPGDSAAASPAPTPAPAPTPNPPLSQTQQPVNITNRFIFETSTLSGAVERTVQKDSEKFSQGLEITFDELVRVANKISDSSSLVVDYADVSRKYFPVAAAVAPLFFVLRLLVYQWSRLGGDQDSIPSVVLDYATAVIFALLIGPLANLIHKFVYWLPANFGVGSINLSSLRIDVGAGGYGIFFTAIMIGLSIAGLLALAAFLIGYLSAFVVLYVLAAIGPIVAVVSVVPQLRWIRNTIIKVAGLVMLLPLLGLVVIKSVQSVNPLISHSSFFAPLARTVLYAGAASIMFSAATVIGKFSWGAVGEGIKGTVRAVGAGLLAATTGGAGAAVGAVGGTAAVGASGGAAAAGGISASSAASAAGSSATAAEAASAGASWLSAGVSTGFSPGTRFVVSSLGTFMGIPHAASAMMRPAPTPSPSAIASARAREFARLNYYDRETESALAGILERTNPNEHEAIANAFHGTLNVLGKQKDAVDNVFVITARAYPFQTADFLRGVAEGRDPLELLGSLDERNPLRAILRTSSSGFSSSPDEPPDGLYPDSAD